MTKPKGLGNGLRGMVLDPLRNFKTEKVVVPEWDDATVFVRAMSADDWLEYRRRAGLAIATAREAAGLNPILEEDEDETPLPELRANALYAVVLVRTLYDGEQSRLFTDNDIEAVARAFSPVHDRLVCKAFELSGATVGTVDPVEAAGNA
jgi:hypothetical protein